MMFPFKNETVFFPIVDETGRYQKSCWPNPFVSMGYITVGIENCVLTAYLIVVAGTREFIQLLPSGNLT